MRMWPSLVLLLPWRLVTSAMVQLALACFGTGVTYAGWFGRCVVVVVVVVAAGDGELAFGLKVFIGGLCAPTATVVGGVVDFFTSTGSRTRDRRTRVGLLNETTFFSDIMDDGAIATGSRGALDTERRAFG